LTRVATNTSKISLQKTSLSTKTFYVDLASHATKATKRTTTTQNSQKQQRIAIGKLKMSWHPFLKVL
jgi:hypothetical protein